MKDDDFNGFSPRPNLTGYTSLPNEFFDKVMPNITSMAELKILLAVFRKTYGWVKGVDPNTGQPIYKLEDEISYSQFATLTGLSSTSIANGLDKAMKDGYIAKVKQGDYSGETSAYRVVTSDGTKPVIEKPVATPPVQSEPEKQPYKPTPLAGFSASSAEVEVKGSKQQLIDEILGTSQPLIPQEAEKEKGPHSQFISEWYRQYIGKYGTKYPNFTGKEHGHIKSLLKDYDIKTLRKAVTFYFANIGNIEGVPDDFATLAIFYGFRHKIIPSSIHGLKKKKQTQKATREFNGGDAWGDDFFDN